MGSNQREQWANSREFFLSCLGYSVGLGNVWRFPYLCYENGGGAFLVPYILFACVLGTPMMFMEFSIGQFTQKGPIGAYDLVPVMKGIGISCVLILSYACIYYVHILAWACIYFVNSFTTKPLPWSTCGNTWNSNNCVTLSNASEMQNSNTTITGESLAVEEFWNNYVLQKSNGIEDIGSVTNWRLILAFVISWLMCYLAVFKGVKIIGKIVYFTAIFPYVLLIILAIRGGTLTGSVKGLKFFLFPEFSKLANPNVWFRAGGQILYTYGISMAVLIALGSYNKFHSNTCRHAVGIAFFGILASVLAGIAVFGVLGHMAHITDRNVTEVVASGPGLVFQAFPSALSLMSWGQLWSVLFFFCLFLVGIDTMFASLECIVCAITDVFPGISSSESRKQKTIMAIVVIFFVSGYPMTFGCGIYIFELFNKSAGAFSLFGLAFLECVTMTYIYGINNFYEDVKTMIGFYPSLYFKVCFVAIIPVSTLVLMVASIIQYEPLKFNGIFYPTWAYVIGWLITSSSISITPVWAIYKIYSADGNIWKKLKESRKSVHIPPEPITKETRSEEDKTLI